MSLDTKYRPLRYAEVMGQDATVTVCKQYVKEGKAFHQSYVFGGAHGSGKTTCGRIMARAMLCENPQDGEPCDACPSCKAMLNDESENFIEVDAATNSGKDHVRRITEEAQFGSFSGRRKIYLFDECHELSKQAMDAMLKPLEDNIRGSEEKQLVCIFCTTEPNKMRAAIMSRCAPAFKIRMNTPEEIAQRLAYICEHEGIEFEPEVLPLIAEVCECHVRDSIKAVEGVSMLGKVTRENVERYLHMDANGLYLDILEGIGFDLPTILNTIDKLNERVSPTTCYERMAEISMLAYRLKYLGSTTLPSYWDRDRLQRVGDLHKEFLVEFAQRFGEHPSYATSAMFACDVAALHQRRAGIVVTATQTVQVQVPATAQNAPTPPPEPSQARVQVQLTEAQVPQAEPVPEPVSPEEVAQTPELPAAPIKPSPNEVSVDTTSSERKPATEAGKVSSEPFVNPVGVHINPQGQQMRPGSQVPSKSNGVSGAMPAADFRRTLHRRVIELTEEQSTSGRPARRDNVGSS